jgi:hypothetical protein
MSEVALRATSKKSPNNSSSTEGSSLTSLSNKVLEISGI